MTGSQKFTGPAISRALRHVRSWLYNPWLGIALVGIVSVLSALLDALLISDGPDFLFNGLNRQEILIPHYRLTFGLLQYPLHWASQFTDDFQILRIAYGIPMVIVPVLMLALSWWVVRRAAPSLFIWAVLGILIANLPGQINWVATSIRTNQLFWPILLAILIGMPNRTIVMAVILAQLMLLLHPHAAAYFLVAALASAWMSWRKPEIRQRMLAVTGASVFFMLMRLAIPRTDYERTYGGIESQLQLLNNLTENGLFPLLILSAVLGFLVLIGPRFANLERLVQAFILGVLLILAMLYFTWGTSGESVRLSSNYRGPVVIVAMVALGLALLDASLRAPQRSVRPRLALANLLCVVFAITICLQSLVIAREVDRWENAIASATMPCIPTSTLEDFEHSPLNNFAFPAASLMLQDREPEHIILPDRICNNAAESGEFPVWENYGGGTVVSGWVDLDPLQFQIQAATHCWVYMPQGWHAREFNAEGDWGRWSEDSGVIRIVTKAPMTVTLTVSGRSFIPDTEIAFTLNGYEIASRELTDEMSRLGPITLNLSAGENLLVVTSNQEPQNPPQREGAERQDSRKMTFFLWSPQLSINESTECQFKD